MYVGRIVESESESEGEASDESDDSEGEESDDSEDEEHDDNNYNTNHDGVHVLPTVPEDSDLGYDPLIDIFAHEGVRMAPIARAAAVFKMRQWRREAATGARAA